MRCSLSYIRPGYSANAIKDRDVILRDFKIINHELVNSQLTSFEQKATNRHKNNKTDTDVVWKTLWKMGISLENFQKMCQY